MSWPGQKSGVSHAIADVVVVWVVEVVVVVAISVEVVELVALTVVVPTRVVDVVAGDEVVVVACPASAATIDFQQTSRRSACADGSAHAAAFTSAGRAG